MSEASEQLSEELSELFREDVSVSEVMHREMGGSTVAVATFSYWTSGENRQQYRQTAVVLQDDQLDLPEFSLRPQMGGLISGLLQSLGGVSNIEYSDSPVFSKKYSLHGWAADAVRVLFARSVRDFFERHPGWHVRGKGKRLVVYHRNRVVKDEDLDAFMREGLEILTLLQKGEEELDRHPAIEREVRPEDISKAASNMGGVAGMLLGNAIRRMAVTRRELELFLTMPVPRDVPVGVRRQIIGENLILVFVGLLFCLAGLIAGTLFVVLGQGAVRLVAIPVYVVFPIAGFLMIFLTLRHRKRKSRTLREGKLVTAKVVDVTKTNVHINNQMRFHMHLSYDLDGRPHSTTMNIYGTSVDQARALKESGKQARCLIDPTDPNHAICVDTLIVLGNESN